MKKNHELQKLLRTNMTRKQFLGTVVVAGASLIGVTRMISELRSQAAGGTGFEPEAGALSAGASVAANASASGGQALKFAGASTSTTTPTPSGTAVPGYLPPFTSRPSGTDYVRWEDLVTAADGLTTATVGSQVVHMVAPNAFQTIVNRCPVGKIITFPAGVFEINSPGWTAPGNCALRWPSQSKGMIGNVPPGDSWNNLAPDSQRTVLRVKANTAPAKNVAGGWLQAGFSGSQPLTIANIHFEGTEQGMQSPADTANNSGPGNDGTSHRLFTNLFVYNVADGSTARDILSTGWFGNNGAPPGETFGIEWYHSTGGILCRAHVDGRRAAGGLIYGGAGTTFGNTLNGIIADSYMHHCGQAGLVFFQTAGCKSYDCVLGDVSDHTTNHVNGNTNSDWLNHERTTGNEHYRMKLNCFRVGASQREHISHSNDSWTLARSGQSVNVANGTLKMVDPTYSNILFGGKLTVSTWIPYSTGNTMTAANVPLIVAADGTTHIPAKWNFGGTWKDI